MEIYSECGLRTTMGSKSHGARRYGGTRRGNPTHMRNVMERSSISEVGVPVLDPSGSTANAIMPSVGEEDEGVLRMDELDESETTNEGATATVPDVDMEVVGQNDHDLKRERYKDSSNSVELELQAIGIEDIMGDIDWAKINETAVERYLEYTQIALEVESLPRDEIRRLGVLENNLMFVLAGLAKRKIKVATFEQLRVAGIELGIKMVPFVRPNDLEKLKQRVRDLYQWHEHEEKTFMAPYFPIIQSSGMGKTKLMHELKESNNVPFLPGLKIVLLLCVPQDFSYSLPKDTVFDKILPVHTSSDEKNKDALLADLRTLKVEFKCEKLLLLVDEAHHLLANDGFLFRVFRWWLRRTDNTKDASVAAIFSGTNSGLANFYSEGTSTVASSRDSGSPYFENATDFRLRPFIDLCTVGCVDYSTKIDSRNSTEYEKAIRFGRPLFAVMHQENQLDKDALTVILRRMLLNSDKWEENEAAQLSILATRVQMGTTSLSVVSELVSKGYCNLTDFNESKHYSSASFCYVCDPVCSRLAMCLMDESWKITHTNKTLEFHGESPMKWTQKAKQIFATGMCTPNKGDIGEIAAALYLLFCGDVIRKQLNAEYQQFSIPFTAWAIKLQNPAAELDSNILEDTLEGQVSFIQFRKFYFRLSLKEMLTQEFLRHLYESGIACYLHDGFPVFDFIASIKKTENDGSVLFRPLLICVKTRSAFGKAERLVVYESMNNARRNLGEATECMLLLLGRQRKGSSLPLHDEKEPTRSSGRTASKSVKTSNSGRNKTVDVPLDDPFGITDMVLGTTMRCEQVEIYASHAELMPFVKDIQSIQTDETQAKAQIDRFLRSTGRKTDSDEASSYLAAMAKGFVTSEDADDTQH
jgi:hypothetical protein